MLSPAGPNHEISKSVRGSDRVQVSVIVSFAGWIHETDVEKSEDYLDVRLYLENFRDRKL